MAKEKKAEKKPEKKKKGGGKIIFLLILIIIILLLLLYLFGDGIGFGFGGTGLGAGDSIAVNATVTAEQTTEASAENTVIVIEISEDKIIFDGTEYPAYEEFEKFFYENDFNGREFILRDNKSIKSVYDSVKKLLDSFGGKYSEEIL